MDRKVRAQRLRHRLKRESYETRVSGIERRRLSVFRSDKHISAQIIDDNAGTGETLVSASTQDKGLQSKVKGKKGMEAAELVGAELAARAKKAGVKDVFFDRSGFRYHGRIKALADAARKGGLNF